MSGESLQVLVADDAHLIHTLFADIAAKSPVPFTIRSVYDGRACMELLTLERIDVAFIDVNMPEMSGMDAVDEARHVGIKTFVALMSANANKRRLQLARRLRVYEFLAKPFGADSVIQILQTYQRVTRPVRALIVDDSATVRRIILKVLNNSLFNFRADEAGNGEAALALIDQHTFDVVFLDCNMPGLNGPETLQRITAKHPGVRVVMISGERNEARRRWTLDHGAFEFLYKPFDAGNVDRVLHEIFGLRMPDLASVEPLKFARNDPAGDHAAERNWAETS